MNGFHEILLPELARIRTLLNDSEVTQSDDQLHQSKETMGSKKTSRRKTRIDHLVELFGLTPFERDILLLCAGMELDPAFARLCLSANTQERVSFPTFSLAFSILPNSHWSALTPVRPLRAWRLVELGNTGELTSRRLKIDERIVHYLEGADQIDIRLKPYLNLTIPIRELPASAEMIVLDSQQALESLHETDEFPILHFGGNDPDGAQAVAAALSARFKAPLYTISWRDIPVHIGERHSFTVLWQREILLSKAALFIDCEDMEPGEKSHPILQFTKDIRGLIFIRSSQPLPMINRACLRFNINKPTAEEHQYLWQRMLKENRGGVNGEIQEAARHFQLTLGAIHRVGSEARNYISAQQVDKKYFWNICRNESRPRLSQLAQHVNPKAKWDDIILPDREKGTLKAIACQVRHRFTVYKDWEFEKSFSGGLGISALFSGPSGTGKTMAAEVLANDLALDLFRIDLSSVVNKYVGETEKNLKRIFDIAENGSAILLFDEADALFGKRSEVKDSHDRYANIEVSYLLQRMESYNGLAILTTNMSNSIDTAFLRRIRFIVEFPFPSLAMRKQIWNRIFPARASIGNIDYSKLARLTITGGNIRNIALNAAFIAADDNIPISMNHLYQATCSEYAKLGKQLTDSECREWT